jgi:hypothetical protein
VSSVASRSEDEKMVSDFRELATNVAYQMQCSGSRVFCFSKKTVWQCYITNADDLVRGSRSQLFETMNELKSSTSIYTRVIYNEFQMIVMMCNCKCGMMVRE